MNASKERFVISRRNTGFGDCIISMISAWWYAKQTGRTLIIDWRRSPYLKERRENAFSVFFEPVVEIEGVPVICDDTVNTFKTPMPVYLGDRFSHASSFSAFLKQWQIFVHQSQIVEVLLKRMINEVVVCQSGQDVSEPTIIFRTCLPVLPPRLECQAVLKHLRPRQNLQQQIEQYARETFSGKPVIAVHVRHGNGGNIMAHTKYWNDESTAIHQICEQIRQSRDQLGRESLVFLCTDSRKALETIQTSLSNVVTRPKYFRPDNAGELHDRKAITAPEASGIGDDALIEMFLLARGDALVCYPPDSYFSFYARMVKG